MIQLQTYTKLGMERVKKISAAKLARRGSTLWLWSPLPAKRELCSMPTRQAGGKSRLANVVDKTRSRNGPQFLL